MMTFFMAHLKQIIHEGIVAQVAQIIVRIKQHKMFLKKIQSMRYEV